MNKTLLMGLSIWATLTLIGGLLIHSSNFAWDHNMTISEIACWTLGGLLVPAGMLAPGFMVARKSAATRVNLIVAALFMGFPIGAVTYWSLHFEVGVLGAIGMATLMWALFAMINLGFVWWGSKLGTPSK